MSNAVVSRNAPCPCGSGRRYKDCHGTLRSTPAASASAAPVLATDGSVERRRERARAALAAGDLAPAEHTWQQVLVADPENAEANFHIGNLHRERGEAHAAITCYQRALRGAPGNAAVLNNLGLALEAVGERERACDCYQKVLATDPSQPDALGNIANALFEKNELKAAADAYARLFAIRRELPVAIIVRRGIVLQRSGRVDEAEACFSEAARRAPDDVRVLANLGSACIEQSRYDAADAPLARARELDPGNAYVASMLAHARAQRCAWDGMDQLFAELSRLIEASTGEASNVAPMPLLAMPLPPQALRRAAANWGSSFAAQPAPARPAPIPAVDGRLRVGFASSDLRPHPMTAVISEVLERLDRARMEVFAYGLMAPDTGPVGRRIAAAVDHFIDLSEFTTAQALQRIRADGIAILFDLNGYTRGGRPELFAQRAAPLQINSIGFPGTLGVDWYDYIHVDPFVAPEAAKPNYAERFFRMPHSYYASDTKRAPVGPLPSRAQCGLPDDAFVFCSFNNAFKILPPIFHAWMRILKATAGSVLWLLDTNAHARANLLREAVKGGIAPGRLVFAPRVGVAEHVARNAAADLFLDTTPYGAHTTANDALLAGLPVLTIAGETFASRVAGSQLHAIGLPELVTASLAEYESLAVALAHDRGRLAELRTRLARNRRTHPLFDMARYARDLEDGLSELWNRHTVDWRSGSR